MTAITDSEIIVSDHAGKGKESDENKKNADSSSSSSIQRSSSRNASSKYDFVKETMAEVEHMDVEKPGCSPRVDMFFDSENEAYEFYRTYAENTGFFIRKSRQWTTSKNIITRRTFVCFKQGFKEKRKRVKESLCPRPEIRTGCGACMTIRLTPNGRYKVTEFESSHNHMLETLSRINIMKLKRMKRKPCAIRADLVDETVNTPEFDTEEEAYEFYNMYAGKVGFTVRKAKTTVGPDNVVTKRVFVCSRQGFPENRKECKRVIRPHTRIGCPACMIIKIAPNGKYHVSVFVTRHNHQLASPASEELIISDSAEADDTFITRAFTDNSSQGTDQPETDLVVAEAHIHMLPLKYSRKNSTCIWIVYCTIAAHAAFEIFEKEFHLYMDCVLYNCGEVGTMSEYKVTTEEGVKDHFVKFDSSDLSASCTCKMFEFVGILCHHVLKVLDSRNIKDLPQQYILKRWRKDVKGGISGDRMELTEDDTRSFRAQRYSHLCRVFSIAAARASKTIDSYTFLESQSHVLIDQVEKILS
ncbi:uncharacterized protein A4U43_C06F1140 [Asparagus officinalis]|uniref:Protein FAR1-RELATED SEQUENCE n=1 Tax=Asparagus officinalis TaxID=4686 RepID=A0A5P1EJ54_ASPOF|nr:uncharacterized protein A4U43_C06F1140 [Asparagus officinalis]